MIDLQTLSIVLACASVSIAAFYYAFTLRYTRMNMKNTLETRQAQLFMGLYETYRSTEFRKQWDDVVYRMEWKDWEDFAHKYDAKANVDERTSWFSVGAFFEGLGVLVKRKLIDISLVDDLLAGSIKMAWERMSPIETESRKRFDLPWIFDDFEYLYNELMKYHEQHPELKT